jgi:cytochrome bd-type quinol oxidase subunit 2
MKKSKTIWRWLLRIPAFLAALMAPALASAQGCALCYSQAAGSGSRLIQALRSGILILVFPPMLISIGLAVMAYRKRNQFNEE